MEAQLDTSRKFFFLPDSLQLGLDGSLSLYVYDDDASPISGSPFAAYLVAAPAEVATVGVYATDAISFPRTGAYTLVWKCASPAISVMQQVSVLGTSTGDFSTGNARKFRYQTPGSVAATDVLLKVYSSAGVKIGGTRTTMGTAQAGVYETTDPILLSDVGVYLFVWTSAIGGYSYTKIEQWLVLPSTTKRTVSIYAIDTSVVPADPQQGIDVLVSTKAGSPVLQSKTNADGRADFALEDGDYVATIRKAGLVYSRNNLEFTATVFPDVETSRLYLIAKPFPATFDPEPLFDASATSLMTLDLSDIRGTPLNSVGVLVSSRYVPDTKVALSGRTAGIFGPPLCVRTDGNGYASVRLLRGQIVTVAIEGTTIRRTFEVPDQSTFELMTVLTGDGDPFDIVNALVQAAESGV